MKRLTVLFASACLLALALAGPAVAQPSASRLSDASTPTVTAILPAMAPNDQDTPVVVSGSGFLSGATATLGTTSLTAVVVESDKLTVRVQRYLARRWVAAKTVLCTIRSGGAYSWWYKPTRKGTYRVRVSIAKTAAHLSGATSWHSFKVR